MSDDAKWVLGLGIPIVLTLGGIIWKLVNSRIESLWDQVGRSSEEGMRKTVHRTANKVTANTGEIDEHGRRLVLLERRVFNGHRKDEGER
jgi:hypothetical protein